jgi:AcrR family transcriptional regulator
MDKVLLDILERAAAMFHKYGIRSVTMDDIARDLTISKKTLYKYVKDKQELVGLVVEKFFEQHDIDKRLEGKNLNAVEEYFEVYNCIRNMVTSANPSMDYDLKKYYPELYKKVSEGRRIHMLEGIKDNMERGIADGFYRDDFDIDIITRWHILRTEELVKSNFFAKNEFNTADVLDEVFDYHLHAIATPKGIKEFKSLLKDREND